MNKSILGALARLFASGVLLAVVAAVLAGGAIAFGVDDTPTLAAGAQPLKLDEEGEEATLQQDIAFTSARTAGDRPLDAIQAGALRNAAVDAKLLLKKNPSPTGPTTFNNGWTALGPNPIVQVQRSDNAFAAQSGRIGALAIRPSNGQFILGGAQGGIWLYDAATGTWSPKTDNASSLSIGSLAVAPSNDSVVYAGTGEGALSGDSMFGDGILRSNNGGNNWTHVSGDYFQGVSVSGLVVDPTNANHLYAAILRGRGGARRVTPPVHSRYGIWESKDGGTTWTLLKEAKSESNGATDIAIDPLNPSVLYSSFWGDAMYKSTDGGQNWSPIMNGLPAGANYAAAQTRFSIGLSHPSGASPAVLYAGFDYIDSAGHRQPGRVWKSTDAGANWSQTAAGTGINSVSDYCGTQCFYDNVIDVDPTNPDVVYAGGSFGYNLSPPSGGIFRSDDGGQSWINLGWDLHPDFHALAFDPTNPNHVLIGNDGGVRFSSNKGGRLNGTSDPLSGTNWQNLDGGVDPATSAVTHRTGLQISQFTSIATVPQVPVGAATERFWGGTQDNGTLRKSVNSASWFDVASGDGGQVVVDPTSDSCGSLGPSCFVYGTYFSPPAQNYRYSDGGNFFTNSFIRNGINVNDRSDFYAPYVLNLQNTNQLFYGTYRLYRTDNARTTSAGDVRWTSISPDLTSGCTGTAPNGARNCSISAIGVGGGQAVYTGSLDGYVYVSTNAQVSDTPNWTRLDPHRTVLPNRPVASIAVDRSNYRIAYLGYNGYNPATPTDPGHVFRTRDGGKSWVDISGNLPDAPVNSLVLDPSYPNTIYAGTDVGPMVTYNGGGHWQPLGAGIPNVSVWQLDMDPAHRIMAAGTHGRGAFRLADTSAAVPALVLSKNDAGVPVGASSNLDYTIKLRNVGNADATGVTITDPLPANTTYVAGSADNGGTFANGVVTWSGLSVPKGVPGTGGSITVHFRVKIADALKKGIGSIVNDGVAATSAEGPSTSGSPAITPIAPPYAVSLSPASQTDGARAGNSVNYHVSVRNLGSNDDSYTMSSTGGTYAVNFFQSDCTTPLTGGHTDVLTAGATADVCVSVAVPKDAVDGDVNTATVTATSVGSPSVSASGTVKTIAVTKDWLLVDNDGNGPDVQTYYTTALNTVLGGAGAYSVWDLAADTNLPQGYLTAHKYVVWFTGNSYPGPITPYEGELKALLDGGGNLFMNGQDILDQAAGTTSFVHDYLHITWDGSETQNDKATAAVHGVSGNPVTDGIGAVPLDHSVLGASFEDRITPNGTATPAFTDDSAATDALSFNGGAGSYKVVFLAFPMEAYGTAADKADLVSRVKAFFGG
jgi:uncharacterized repeat protein (TIGR01451 family)